MHCSSAGTRDYFETEMGPGQPLDALSVALPATPPGLGLRRHGLSVISAARTEESRPATSPRCSTCTAETSPTRRESLRS